jgi:hypothetical protein
MSNVAAALEALRAKRDKAQALADMAPALLDALEQIAALHPDKDSDEGYNEWGEAECFRKAQRIANKALGK